MSRVGEWILGIDTGGTFTDIVCRTPKELLVLKVPSTRDDPSRAILRGLEELVEREGAGISRRELVASLVHGSTVATNTILERKGARTALVTTRGFRDLVEIGRQNRDELYSLEVSRPEPLAPRRLRVEVDERVLADGEVDRVLDEAEVASVLARLAGKVDSVAVGLLFSFRNDVHERAVARVARRVLPDVPMTLSSRVSPEIREYERFSTAILNAYVAPRMISYLDTLRRGLRGSDIEIMGSGGGTIPLKRARDEPVRTVLSGPAAGVLGARDIARRAGVEKVITFDMGGTSTDVALVDGEPTFRGESRIGDLPFRLRTLDVHTVGAGGGSIARVDAGGSLKVGPESAGADPGPAVYGRGDDVTVTDANVLLGYLGANSFLGGAMTIHPERAERLIGVLATELGLTPHRAAQGVIDVVNAEMERAIRVVSQERGHDPRDFALFAFGGASGLHAATLARGLLIPRVIVPPHPGMLCAWGMLAAERVRWRARSVQSLADNLSSRAVERIAKQLVRQGVGDFPGIARRDVRPALELDLRFDGQTHVLTLACETRRGRGSDSWRFDVGDYVARFRERYADEYSPGSPAWRVELVTVRVSLSYRRPEARPATHAKRHTRRRASDPKPSSHRSVHLGGASRATHVPIFRRDDLVPGARIRGPACIAEYSGTTWVPEDFETRVDGDGNLVMESE